MNKISLSEQKAVHHIRQVPRYLFHPLVVRLLNNPRDMNSTGFDVYNEQNIESNEPERSENFYRKEICSDDLSEMHLDKGGPIHALASLRRGINTVSFQNALHSRSTDRNP